MSPLLFSALIDQSLATLWYITAIDDGLGSLGFGQTSKIHLDFTLVLHHILYPLFVICHSLILKYIESKTVMRENLREMTIKEKSFKESQVIYHCERVTVCIPDGHDPNLIPNHANGRMLNPRYIMAKGLNQGLTMDPLDLVCRPRALPSRRSTNLEGFMKMMS